MESKKSRIEICGGIAAGKTTLSKLIQSLGFTSVNEKFKLNPFLNEFYEKPDLFSFETELTFILQHYHAIKSLRNDKYIVCDFSLYLDYAYADVTLNTETEKAVFLSLFNEVVNQISEPDLLIYLKCPSDVLLYRIQKRDRKMESNITIEYLNKLIKSIENKIYKSNANIIVLNSDQINFAYNVNDQKKVLEIINNKVITH